MIKRIGILGGISCTSTIRYYELILERYFEKFKDYHYPDIVIFSLDFQKFTDFEDKKDIKRYIEYIMSGVNSLQDSKVPMLSIAEVTAENARAQGINKLLLLGIKFTMQSTFYQEGCNEKGINVITPNENEQDEVNKIIFDELCIGNFKNKSKKRLLKIIDNYNVECQTQKLLRNF